VEGFSNRQLVTRVGPPLGGPYGPRKATYDLRRLRRRGLICRRPKSQRYELTSHGRRDE
jgi:hypothetical protein